VDDRAGEALAGVVGLSGCQAVVELTEHLVEQVPQCGRMPVSMVSSAQVVLAAGRGSRRGRKRPGVPDAREPVVLRAPTYDAAGLARRLGDRCRPGERLERSVIAEPGAVIAHLCQDHRATGVGQAGEAGNDLVVRVLGEGSGGRCGELVHGPRLRTATDVGRAEAGRPWQWNNQFVDPTKPQVPPTTSHNSSAWRGVDGNRDASERGRGDFLAGRCGGRRGPGGLGSVDERSRGTEQRGSDPAGRAAWRGNKTWVCTDSGAGRSWAWVYWGPY